MVVYHVLLFLEALYEPSAINTTIVRYCVKPHLDSVFNMLANLTTFLCSVCEPHPNLNLFPFWWGPIKRKSNNKKSSCVACRYQVWRLLIHFQLGTTDNYTLPVWDWVYCGTDFGNMFLTVVNFIYKTLEGEVLPLTKN